VLLEKFLELERIANSICDVSVTRLLRHANGTQTVATCKMKTSDKSQHWKMDKMRRTSERSVSAVGNQQLDHVFAADANGKVKRRLTLL